MSQQARNPLALHAPIDLSRAPGQHILPAQRLLDSEAGCEAVLAYLRGDEVAARLRTRWARGGARGGDLSVQRWEDLEAELSKARPSLLRRRELVGGDVSVLRGLQLMRGGSKGSWQ